MAGAVGALPGSVGPVYSQAIAFREAKGAGQLPATGNASLVRAGLMAGPGAARSRQPPIGVVSAQGPEGTGSCPHPCCRFSLQATLDRLKGRSVSQRYQSIVVHGIPGALGYA